MRNKWWVLFVALLFLSALLPAVAAEKPAPGPVAVRGGAPWVRFEAARDLAGPRGEAAPSGSLVAMAAGDFDRDGVKDLICASTTGQVSLWKGNADVFHPFEEAARRHRADGTYTDAPFVATGAGYSLPITPDFVGAGDFNGDGKLDVVAASLKDKTLYMVPGDGRGGFGPYQTISLPGKLTAIAVGEMNRADGLADVVVSVKKGQKGQLLIFEGPNGALNRVVPEAIALQAPATSLALGVLPGSVKQDVVAAAGRTLYVVWGRDRKLSLDTSARSTVGPAVVESRKFSKNIQSVAIGRFNGDQSPVGIAVLLKDGSVQVVSPQAGSGTLAAKRTALEAWAERPLQAGSVPGATQMVAARISSRPGDDVILLNPTASQVTVLEGNKAPRANQPAAFSAAPTATSLDVPGGAAAVLPMRLNQAALKGLVILKNGAAAPTTEALTAGTVYTVTVDTDDNVPDGNGDPTTNTGDLRWCINQANANPGLDTIRFGIPAPPNIDIWAEGYWPDITDPVILDGTSQPGYYYGGGLGGAITIAPAGFYVSGGGSTIMGFEIWTYWDYYYTTSGAMARRTERQKPAFRPRTEAAGQAEQDPIAWAIILEENGGNVVQSIFTTAMLQWDYYPNALVGVGVYSPDNQIGGTNVADRNVLSNVYGAGVDIYGEYATGNVVEGNWIGPDVTGQNAIGNGYDGVFVGSANNTIGGTDYGAGNVISGNFWYTYQYGVSGSKTEIYPEGAVGVYLQSWSWDYLGPSSANRSQTARIMGGAARARQDAASPKKASGKGFTPQAGRAEQDGFGGNLVQQNLIGLDASGTHGYGYDFGFFGNYIGVYGDYDEEETVGGTSPLARNVISNNDVGVNYDDCFASLVQGNYIGTDITGRAWDGANSVGNYLAGVLFDDDTTDCSVGGTAAGAGNVIAGNAFVPGARQGAGRKEDALVGVGILIEYAGANTIQGNLIGLDATGTATLPNFTGIELSNSGENLIGGTDEGATNWISGNMAAGIYGEYTGADVIQGNVIGLDTAGDPAGNNWEGIYLYYANGETIGGSDPGAPNEIANNDGNGVLINGGSAPSGARTEASNSDGNLISQNSIHDNGGYGIWLASGANNGQMYPALASAFSTASGTVINGSVSGFLPSTAFTLEFFYNPACDSTGYGEGQTYLGSLAVTTDGSGSATFAFNTPTVVPGGDSVSVTATDPANNTSSFSACQEVIGCPAITLSPTTLPDGEAGVAYGPVSITASGGAAPYTYAVTAGALPDGLTLDSDGTLHGTPTVGGSFTFTVTATDDNGCTGQFEYTLQTGCPTITIDPAALPAAQKGVAYSQTLTASGGTGPYTYAVTAGSLPPGLTLDPNTGVLSGTPTANGSYSFTVTATDANGCTGSQAYASFAVFGFFFYDDNGRAQFCADPVSGAYAWNVLTGGGAGQNFYGTALVLNAGNKFTSQPGDPISFSVLYDPVQHKAKGWLITNTGVYVPLTDSNTLNNVGGCF